MAKRTLGRGRGSAGATGPPGSRTWAFSLFWAALVVGVAIVGSATINPLFGHMLTSVILLVFSQIGTIFRWLLNLATSFASPTLIHRAYRSTFAKRLVIPFVLSSCRLRCLGQTVCAACPDTRRSTSVR